MKNKIIFYLVILMQISFACQDYLDVVPENDITTIESIFIKRNTALDFFSGCYKYYNIKYDSYSDPSYCGVDEFTTGEYFRNTAYSGTKCIKNFYIAQGLQSVSNPIGAVWDKGVNYYQPIRTCNVFINNIDKVYNMTKEEKEQYKASAKAVKAWYYFQMLRQYGPIVLVPANISVEANIEKMQQPRSPLDTCVNRIVQLFEEAIPYLENITSQPTVRTGLMTKEAAYAYKAKVLVYAASPLFNGNEWYANFKNRDGINLFNSEYDREKWRRAAEACDEAVEYCENQGRALTCDINDQPTPLLNTIRNLQKSSCLKDLKSAEVIYGFVAGANADVYLKVPRYNEEHPNFNPRVDGCLNPSFRMVETYYTDKGLPLKYDESWHYKDKYRIGAESDYKYKDVIALDKPTLKLHLKREPRFYASIGFDKGIWVRGTEKVELKPYHGDDHGFDKQIIELDSRVNTTGYWCKKGVHPENCPAQNVSAIQARIVKIRMADLYLMQSEAWNEYLASPDEKVWGPINKVRERAGIYTVQDSYSKYAVAGAKNRYQTKTGMREIIREERTIELAFEGHRFWDLRRWKIAHEYMTTAIKGWNVFGSDSQSFYNDYKGPVEVWNGNKFQVPRDYLWPLRDEEILKSNIVQNPGW